VVDWPLLCRAAPIGLLLITPVIGCSSNGDLTPPAGHYDVAAPAQTDAADAADVALQAPADAAAPRDMALPDAPPPAPDRPPADLAPPGDGGTADAGQYIPCDVEAVLKAKCHVCHTDPPQMDAPRPLLTYQNIAPVRMLMEMYVKIDFMPYIPPGATQAPNGPLSAAQKATLLDWLAMGGLPSPTKCP
jgi:hypothetical protein